MKLICLFIFLISTTSYARILVEPYLGYKFSGSISGDSISTSGFGTSASKGTYSTPEYGARLGWTNLALELGLDYVTTKSALLKITPAIPDYTPTFSSSFLGAFVGYSFAGPMRLVGTFFFQSTLNLNGDTAPFGFPIKTTDSLTGTGYQVIAFYQLNSFLNVGLEYTTINYNSFTQTITGLELSEKATGVVPSKPNNSLALLLSIPFSF